MRFARFHDEHIAGIQGDGLLFDADNGRAACRQIHLVIDGVPLSF